MSISVNYATPVTVNGFFCKTCTEVDEAKKFIDPAHPADGPFGIYAPTKGSKSHGSGVPLNGPTTGPSFSSSTASAVDAKTGRRFDIVV